MVLLKEHLFRRDSELIGWVRNSFWLNPKCGQDWLMRICLELSDLCIFIFFFLQQFYLVFTLGQGLVRFHGGGATKGLEQRHKRDIRARTQTDRQTDRQEVLTHRQTQQQNSQGDFNIAVSRLMQPKKISVIIF